MVKKKGESLEAAVDKVRDSMRKGDEKPKMADFKKQMKSKMGVGKKKATKKAKADKFDNFEICLPKNEEVKAK